MSTSVCGVCFAVKNLLCPAASPCTRLSRAPSTTSRSDFHRGIRSPMDGPFSRRTPHFFSAKTAMDLPSSVMLPFPPYRALRPRRGLRFPRLLRKSTIAFQVFDLVGPRTSHEALSLHLRYGLDVALSTLNPYRYLYVLKTRFRVGRLIPFARVGIAPTESTQLT
ncbi:hypothetical protein D3C74_237130 [compost metagenome]